MNLSDIGKRRIAFCKYFLTETFTKAEIVIYRKIIHLFRYSNSLNFICYVFKSVMHPIPNTCWEKKFLDKIHNGVSSDLSQAVFYSSNNNHSKCFLNYWKTNIFHKNVVTFNTLGPIYLVKTVKFGINLPSQVMHSEVSWPKCTVSGWYSIRRASVGAYSNGTEVWSN